MAKYAWQTEKLRCYLCGDQIGNGIRIAVNSAGDVLGKIPEKTLAHDTCLVAYTYDEREAERKRQSKL